MNKKVKKIKLFSTLYEWTLRWAEHKFSPYILAILTFSESIFFPIPPDVMLAPMVLAKPEKAWGFASLATFSSVIGGIVGYLLGYLMFEPWIQPLIIEFGYQARFDQIMTWFSQWGIWVVFLAGFSPVPYKLFTLSSGLLQMAFVPFLLASAISRGMRFFLVASLMKLGGKPMEEKLRQWVDAIGWSVVIIVVVAYLLIY